MINDVRRLTDTLRMDSRAVKVLTFKLKDGTVISSDHLVFIESVIDVIRDTRPIWSGRAGEREVLMGYLPPLASGEVVLRFRLLADMGGNILTFSKPFSWRQRVEWKIGYAIGYLLGLMYRPKPKSEPEAEPLRFKDDGTFDWEEWTL